MSWRPWHRSDEQSAVLARIVDAARRAGRGHTAVFDLDGCLFDTRPRQVHILREYASRTACWALYQVRPEHFVDWNLDHTLRNAGVDEALIDELRKPLGRFWWDRFFDGDYLVHDLAMPGAVQLVRGVHEAGLHCVYLTGRHTPMRAGTERALRRHGFPYDDPRSHLVVKRHIDDDDTAYKANALEALDQRGTIVLFLDNEPSNVNVFADRHPEALVVWLMTDHSPRPVRAYGNLPRLFGFLA